MSLYLAKTSFCGFFAKLAVTTPSKNLGGRPKRARVLAEAAFRMRQGGKSLRQVQAWLNSQGVRACYSGGEDRPERPYFLVGRRWADSGAETLGQFRAAEGQELVDLTIRRYLEAQDRLWKDMVRVEQVDDEGWMIPFLHQEVDARVVRLIRDSLPREDALRLLRKIVARWELGLALLEIILKHEIDLIAACGAALGIAADPAIAALEDRVASLGLNLGQAATPPPAAPSRPVLHLRGPARRQRWFYHERQTP